MAANDYYNTSFSPAPAHPQSHDRTDAPLPPTPAHNYPPPTQPLSPVAATPSSPLDNRRYDYPTHPGAQSALGAAPYDDTAYHGASANSPYDNRYDNRYDYSPGPHGTDPFADQNAIPLQNQHAMSGGAGKMTGSPTAYSADPERNYPVQPYPVEKRKKKKGWFSGRVTWVCYILTAVQIGVFVGELIRNGTLTGSPIQTKPSFNIMIGPSPYVLINMGARYPPCMHNIRGVTDFNTPLCGMGSGVPEQTYPTDFRDRSHEPNQWWRFIVPIFLHAGIIHIGFNLLLQMTLGRDMEKEIGPLRFILVYFSAGIFGFVLGGNYSAPNIPSVGASGSLFGILALVLLDLLYNWNSRRSPVKDLLFLFLDIAIAFVLGLLPGLDNFSHIGGFLMGLVLGICLLHSPQSLRERIGVDEPPYATVATDTQPLNSDGTPMAVGGAGAPKVNAFIKKPIGFFKGRKSLWWAWWLVRAGALLGVFIGFILLLRNFYEWRNECSWCHHLTCLPISTGGVDWCDIGNFNLQEGTSSN